MFTKKMRANIVVMLVYVDDLLKTCNDIHLVTEWKYVLEKKIQDERPSTIAVLSWNRSGKK